MIKRFTKVIITINICLLVLVMLVLQNGHLEVANEVEEYCLEEVDSCYELKGDDKYEFWFQNSLSEVDNIILRFRGCAGHENGTLKVTVESNFKEYYAYEVPVNALSEDLFYLYTNEIDGLKKGHKYCLTVSVSGMGEDKIYLDSATKELIDIKRIVGDESLEEKSPIIGLIGTTLTMSDEWNYLFAMWIYINVFIIGVSIILYVVCLDKERKNVILQYEKEWKTLSFRYRIRIFILFGILGCVILYAYLGYNDFIGKKEIDFGLADNASEYEYLELKKGPVIQEFEAQYDGLNEFHVIFDNFLSDETTKLSVELVNSENEIWYSWSEQVSNFNTSTFYLIGDVEQKLEKGKNYYLIISIDNKDSDITVRTVREQNFYQGIGNLSTLEGELSGQAVYMYCKYEKETYYPALWIVFILISIVFLVLLALNNKKYILWINTVGLLVVMPIAGYVSIENMSGNLNRISIFMASRNILILIIGYLFLILLFGKRWGIHIMNWLTQILGIANYFVYQFRGSELTVYDIRSATTAKTVANNYEFVITSAVLTALLVAVLMTLLWEACIDRLENQEANIGIIFKKVVKKVVVCCASLFIVLFLLYGYMQIDGIGFSVFDLSKSISQYGWLYSNMFLIKNFNIEKPNIYSDESLEEIIENIEEVESIQAETIVPENIIVIMNESLADLELIKQLDNNIEYMPFIKSLDENCVKGNLHVSTFGGGTCITEYEFLTGNTQNFFPNIASPYISICEEEEAGICSTLKEQNYYTVAMHPFEGSNWDRDRVYPAMGFDEFLTEEDFINADRERNFVSDFGNYEKIIEYYESFEGDEGLFIFNVTMQNHGGYGINNGITEKTVYLDEYQDDTIDTYLSLVYRSDQAFEYLLSYFSEVSEPTMIVMFGDHFPSLPSEFYTYLYGGKEASERSGEEKSKMYMTPYIIWTNYESDFEEIGDISANYLGSYMLECAGVKMTGYDNFLVNQMRQIPVIGKFGLYNADREFISYDEIGAELLTSYQQLQYMRIKDRDSQYYSLFEISE